MKKSLLSLFILFSALACFSQVTNIDSFYLPGSEWKWRNSTHPGLTGTPCKNIFYSHKIERDSIINGMNYHLVSARDIGTNDCNTGSPLYHINNEMPIFGGIRVDGRKVYFLLFDTLSTVNAQHPYVGPSWQELINGYTPGVEELTYDFDLAIGSTLSFKPGFTVSAIDTVAMTNGDSLKTYSFTGQTNSQNDKWIEGIGSASNFFLTQGSSYPFTKLVCYSGAPGSYRQESNYCTYLETDIKEQNLSDEKLVLYPNPLNNDVLQLKAGKTISAISISDVSGKGCEQFCPVARQASINTALTTGLYFIKVYYQDGSTEVQKLVRY